MPKGVKVVKKKFTEEQWDEMVGAAFEKYLSGYFPSRIKEIMHRDYGLPYTQFNNLLKDVKKRLVENTEIYHDKALELQIARLQELMNDTSNQNDAQMVLKCIAELNKLLKLYEQKVTVKVEQYELEI